MHLVLHEIAEAHRGETVLAVSHGGVMRLTPAVDPYWIRGVADRDDTPVTIW